MLDYKRTLRQGDVILVPVEGEVVASTKDLETKVVRKGENGGVHQLEDTTKATLFEGTALETDLFGTFVHVVEPTNLVHTTHHDPIPLEPGDYMVLQQREFFGNTSRAVYD